MRATWLAVVLLGSAFGPVRSGAQQLSDARGLSAPPELSAVQKLSDAQGPPSAQEEPVPTSTRAQRGLAIGAVIGAVLGGVGLGVFAAGYCDGTDCDASFLEGFWRGAVAGAAGGGLTGLVVGSVFPRDGPALGGWSWSARAGLRGADAADVSGLGPVAEVRALKAITHRTHVGVGIEYLGGDRRRSTYQVMTRDRGSIERTDVRDLQISGVRIVAARLLGTTPESGASSRSGGYLLAAVGLHPTWERTTSFALPESGEVERSSYGSFVPAPGGGVGVGFVVPIGGRWALDVGARGDLLVGIGSGGIVRMAQVTAGIRRER